MVSVLLEPDVLFVHVPKTGGGSISRALRQAPRATILPVENMAVAAPCVQQLRARLARPWSAYRSIAFVRNPWDWTVSGYLHVTQNMPAYERAPSFRDFVAGDIGGASLSPYPEKFANPDAYVGYLTQITQWAHLHDGGAELSQICRFETLAADAHEMFAIAALPHANRSEDRAHYSHYYDPHARELVAGRNRELIARFGYTFETA